MHLEHIHDDGAVIDTAFVDPDEADFEEDGEEEFEITDEQQRLHDMLGMSSD
jgi:hypothetical protein